MSESAGDDFITVPAAAKLLGLQFRTVYYLIDRGELPAEVTLPPGPKRRRSVRVRRQDVEHYIDPDQARRAAPPARWGHGETALLSSLDREFTYWHALRDQCHRARRDQRLPGAC